MKKKLKWLVGLFFAFLVIFIVLLVLPFLIDLNKFKPQIQNAVSENLNAKIDFSSARLSILSGLGFVLQDVSVENTDAQFKGKNILQVKEIKLRLELFPLLKRIFIGSAVIDKPSVLIVKDDGKNNITSLGKTPEKPNQELKSTKKEDKDQESKETPDGKSKNLFGGVFLIKSFHIKDADITYQDVTKGENNKPISLRNLNIEISDVGLDKDTKIDLSTDVKINDNKLKIDGPFAFHIVANTHVEQEKWISTKFRNDVDFDKINFNFQDAFVKSNKVPFHIFSQGTITPEKIQIENVKLSLENLLAKVSAVVQNSGNYTSRMDLNLSTDHIEGLKQFFPQYHKLLSKGSFNLVSHMQGDLKNTNSIKSNFNLKLNMYNSDLSLVAAQSSLEPLQSTFQAQSKSLRIGEILKPFVEKKSDKQSSQMNYDDLIVNNFYADGQISDLKLTVNKLKMNLFSGDISSTHLGANLKDKTTPFDGNIDTKNMELGQVVRFVQNSKSSPIEGKFDLFSTFNGKGATGEMLGKTLNAKGHFLFHDGQLVGNRDLAGYALNQVTESLFHFSIPNNPLSDAVLHALNLGVDDKTILKKLKGDFEIHNGKLVLSNIANQILENSLEGIKNKGAQEIQKNIDKGAEKIQKDTQKFLKDTFGF